MGGESLKFLTNQSSILLNSDTNDVTVNGVNVIVDKPKRGDVMCVKDGQVIWIDGLSINPEQLSSEIDPVGICRVVDGNKAIVSYKQTKNLELITYDWANDPNNHYFISDLGNYIREGIVDHFYLNNGFKMSYPYLQFEQIPISHSYAYYGMIMDTNIMCLDSFMYNPQSLNFSVNYCYTGVSDITSYWPVSKKLFENSSYCQILRDTYNSYDEYLYSKMIMYPCGKGGAITEQSSGKETTHILKDIDSIYGGGKYEPYGGISPAAYWCSKISLDAPNLGEYNWWIPSLSELAQMGHELIGLSDISDDIVYKVLDKLKSVWSINDVYGMTVFNDYLTSTIIGDFSCYYTCKNSKLLRFTNIIYRHSNCIICPITIYEF